MSAACVRTTLSVLALVLAGCSGAGNQDLFDESAAGNDSSSVSPSPTPGTPEPPTKPQGPSTDPGPSPTPTPGPTPQPKELCTQEKEPNNNASRATEFTSSLCGKIETNSDVDYGTFTVPKGATTVILKHNEDNGNATYSLSRNGFPAIMLGDELPVEPGETYAVRISSAGGKPTYELDILFQ